MKRLARYLVNVREVKLYYRWQDEIVDLCTCVDSDWAGCRKTRKSTSGGCMMVGAHLLRSWSSTQPVIAMSSAEAEYYALVEGATRSLGLQSMMRELGLRRSVFLQTDSSAAKSFASQRGLGRMRHIEVKDLWLQEAICRSRLKVVKIRGDENPADIFTKYLSAADTELQCARMSVELVRESGSE